MRNDLVEPAPRVSKGSSDMAPIVASVIAESAPMSEETWVQLAPEVNAVTLDGIQQSRKKQRDNERVSTSVPALRKMAGNTFETYAAVIKGPGDRFWYQRMFSMIFEERNYISYGEAERFILVKGSCCFVFIDERASQPLYAINLNELYAELESRTKPDKRSITVSPEGAKSLSSTSLSTVLLKFSRNNKIAYQLTFNVKADKSVVDRFLEAASSGLKYADDKVAYRLT